MKSPKVSAPASLPVPETRAPLSVLSYSPTAIKQQHRVNIDTKTLLRIEEVKLHLECKGKSPNTLDGFERHIKQLAQRANLDIPQDVELAIARYKLIDRKTWKPSNQPASNTYKQKLCDMYNHYNHAISFTWLCFWFTLILKLSTFLTVIKAIWQSILCSS